MAKITINPTKPSDEKSDNTDDDQAVIVDSKGRSIKIKQLDVLSESRLTRALGSEAAMNAAYMLGFVLPAASVCEIDGEAVPAPMTQREIDANIARLGREGITAIMNHLQAQGDKASETDAEIKN